MEALQRIAGIGKTPIVQTWTSDDFRKAGIEAKRRWEEIQELFEIRYYFLEDVVSLIASDWRLPVDARATISNAPQRRGYSHRVLLPYVNWEYCPSTKGLPNPYEPWIEILEHGGSFQVEHSQFCDIFDHTGMPVGGQVFSSYSEQHK